MARTLTPEHLARMKAGREAARQRKAQGAEPMARRGRRAKQKAASTMSDDDYKARQAEARALLGPRKRRKSRRPKGGGGLIAIIMGGSRGKRTAGKTRRRTMARGRKGGNAQGNQSYAAVTGQFPVQVAMEAAEVLFTLGSVAVDVYTASTTSTADDTAFPVVVRVLQSGSRYAAGKFLSRRHPALAAAIAAGMSAANGDRNGNFIRNRLKRLLQPAGTGSPAGSRP